MLSMLAGLNEIKLNEMKYVLFNNIYINLQLIIDKFPVEFSILMPLLHLTLETTYRFIHVRHFFAILL